MTVLVVLAVVWLVCISVLLIMLKRASYMPWWERTLFEIDSLPTTTRTPERQLLD